MGVLLMLFRSQRAEREQISEKTKQILRDLVRQHSPVEFHRQNQQGITFEIGKCRIHEFDEQQLILIVDVPSLNGHPLPLVADEVGFIYVQHNGSLFRFETSVVEPKVHRNSKGGWFSAVVLTAPARIENGNRRRHFRITPLIKDLPTVNWRPCVSDLVQQSNLPWVPAQLRDISSRGMAIWMPTRIWERLRPGVRLELDIVLPTGVHLQVLAAIRRLVEDPSREGEQVVCLEFVLEESEEDDGIDSIATYVAACQREIARTQR